MALEPHPNDGKGGGRPKGSKNKIPGSVKQMVLDALDELGGKEFLKAQAKGTNASAFMTLIGKIIPTQISNADGETFKTEQILPEADKAILEHYIKTKEKL